MGLLVSRNLSINQFITVGRRVVRIPAVGHADLKGRWRRHRRSSVSSLQLLRVSHISRIGIRFGIRYHHHVIEAARRTVSVTAAHLKHQKQQNMTRTALQHLSRWLIMETLWFPLSAGNQTKIVGPFASDRTKPTGSPLFDSNAKKKRESAAGIAHAVDTASRDDVLLRLVAAQKIREKQKKNLKRSRPAEKLKRFEKKKREKCWARFTPLSILPLARKQKKQSECLLGE